MRTAALTCAFLSLAVLASSGCHGTATKTSPEGGPPRPIDASPDASSGELAMDFGCDDWAPDLGTALALDTGTDAPALDVAPMPDVPLDPSHDLGTDLRAPVVDSPLDLGTDLHVMDSPLHSGLDASLDLGRDVGLDTLASACPPGTPYVLVLSGHAEDGLYRFYPETFSLDPITTVSCGSPTSALNSLTASPSGPAYVSNLRGELCVVNRTTFTASPTRFDAAAIANLPFGMALLPDTVPPAQTLYLALQSPGQADTLARVDLSTFGLTALGPIELHQDASTQLYSQMEITGSSTGQLYGFSFDTNPPLLLAIDPKTGAALPMAEVPVANPGGFALVDWHGTIYLFFAEAGARGSTVFTYRHGDAQVSRIGAIDVAVIGAGVTLCP